MADAPKWQSTEQVTVTKGPASLVWDGALLYLASLDQMFPGQIGLSDRQRIERQRMIGALRTLGAELGVPPASLETLAGDRDIRVVLSTARTAAGEDQPS